jgi:TRAP-type C4-dicarboxylate transport system substrate-binding protein
MPTKHALGRKTMLQRAVFGAVLATGLALSSAASAQVDILVNIFVGPQHFIHGPYKAWGEQVGEVTEGRVQVEFLPAPAAPPPKQIEAAVAGNYDGAFMFNGFNARVAPFTQMLLLPYASQGNAEAGSVATWRTYDKFFSELGQFEAAGVTPLSYFQFPGGHMFSGTDDPIATVDDLRGRKMWALAGPAAKTLELAGVEALVAGPAARVSEFCQTNVVDGVAGISHDAIITFGCLEFTKSLTAHVGRRLVMPNFLMFVTNEKWAEISAEDQALIRGISGETFARAVGIAADGAEDRRIAQLTEAGVQFTETSESFAAELRAAAQPLYDAWATSAESMGVPAQEPIDFYQNEVRNYSGS